MKLNDLQRLKELKSLDTLPTIKPLIFTRVSIENKYLNSIELLLYSTNLCLFSARILRDEIQVKNKYNTLQRVSKEISILYTQIQRDDYATNITLTHKDIKKKFKEFGIKPKHLEH